MKAKHENWRQWITSNISARTRCLIYVEGEIGTEEIDNLIELLGISRQIYAKAELKESAK